jgi:hypothetical protein
MTEAADIERRKRRQAEFVTDEQQRLLEIEEMRLVVKFGDKKRYSDREYEAIYQGRGRTQGRSMARPGRHRGGFQEAQRRRGG